MAGEGGAGFAGLAGPIGGIIRLATQGRGKTPTQYQVSQTVAALTPGEQGRIAAQWGIPIARVAGWSLAHGARLGVGGAQQAAHLASLGFSPAPGGPHRPESVRAPTRTGTESGLTPALWLSSAARAAAATRLARSGGLAGSIYQAQQAGNPPGTGSGVGGGASSPAYSPLTDPTLWLALADYILEWVRKPPKAPTPIYDTGGLDVAYLLSPQIASTPWYEQLGAAVGGGLNALVGAFRGGAPQAMPGGASMAGVGSAVGALARRAAPLAIGLGAAGAIDYLTGTPMARRGPSIFTCEDPFGNMVAVRRAGTPIAWSGDLTAYKRLKRAHSRIGKCLGPRSGGYRRRGRR